VSVNKAYSATAVTAGLLHTCATFATGFSFCWGRNFFGQIGDGTTTDRLEPAVVRDIAGTSLAERVAVGERHSCAVRDNGTVACWGDNSLGQLGDGTTTSRLIPVTVGGQSRTTLLTQARAVAAGDRHTCAHLVNSIRCWGDNSFGQLGDGTTTTRLTSVAAFTSPFTEALAVGDFHNCTLLGNRTVRCWGRNNAGQLGDGTTTNRLTPVEVVGLTGIKAIVTGSEHSCALHGDGAVSCWGRNDRGQLGYTGPASLVPARIGGLANIVALAAGNLHTCGLTANGFAICWGANEFGQIGNGLVQASSLPTVARVPDNAIAIAAGDFYSCALLRIGYVSCWGLNGVGQLGDGTTTNRPTPVNVLNPFSAVTLPLSGSVQIALGARTSCARSAQGALLCWGSNSFGQIGNGTMVDSSRPVVVPSFTLNIDPEGSLRRNEKGAIVRVQAVCDEDQRLSAAVTLTQDHVVAEGHAQGDCTGRLEAYPVKVHTQRAEEFASGTARVEAAGEIVSRGQTVQRQEWGRQVTISAEP
jgi:alpha-tubulin suppressor-like RCC1 family protein